MDAPTCLKKLSLVGVLAFATVDASGAPQVRNISAIHYGQEEMYFFTARGKAFCRELLWDGRVQVLGYTRFKEMIRLSGVARPVPEEEQRQWIDTIFREQPYLGNLYPGEIRHEAGIVFRLGEGELEYFHLGVSPIFRERYALGGGQIRPRGYRITGECIGCGTCLEHCPEKCIEPGLPFRIQGEHCLHCGNCFALCPVQAVERLEDGERAPAP